MRGHSFVLLVLSVVVVVALAAGFFSPRRQASAADNPAEQNKKVAETLAFLVTMPTEDTEGDREMWNFIISRMFVTPEANPYLAKMADVEPYSATWLEQLSKAIDVTRETTEQDAKALEEQINNDPKLKELIEGNSAAFDPQWSERPGLFEAHLRCRHESPIFPPSRRRITLSELEEASPEQLLALLQPELEAAVAQVRALVLRWSSSGDPWRA